MFICRAFRRIFYFRFCLFTHTNNRLKFYLKYNTKPEKKVVYCTILTLEYICIYIYMCIYIYIYIYIYILLQGSSLAISPRLHYNVLGTACVWNGATFFSARHCQNLPCRAEKKRHPYQNISLAVPKTL